ncbi:MAG: hypothetical protein Alis3KO_19280 [Aliiglaciecola sp.]
MFKKGLFVFVCGLAVYAGITLSLSMRTDFTTLDGEGYSWQGLEEQIVVVNYFAEWCAPCLKEVPELNDFDQFVRQTDKVSLFAVNFDNVSDEQLTALRDKYDMQFKMVSGLPKKAPFSMPKSLPATFIIGTNGELIKELKGEQSAESLEAIVLGLQKIYQTQ